MRSALQLFLQLAGHSVATVDSGRAALAEIERTDPDVVLLDIDMPDLDGYAVAKMVQGVARGLAAAAGGDDRKGGARRAGPGAANRLRCPRPETD